MITEDQKAVELFCKGYNCAQSTAAAFADEAGMNTHAITTTMAGFIGGIGGTRELCGEVTNKRGNAFISREGNLYYRSRTYSRPEKC